MVGERRGKGRGGRGEGKVGRKKNHHLYRTPPAFSVWKPL